MSEIVVIWKDIPTSPWQEVVPSFVARVLEEVGKESGDIAVVMCSPEFIQELNRTFRGKDEPTDVLSFPDSEGGSRIQGDIVIAPEVVVHQAADWGVPAHEELLRVILHGLLHLSGMDHMSTDPSEPMLVYQEDILSRVKEEYRFEIRT